MQLPGPQLETPEWAAVCPPGPKLLRKVRVRAARVESDGEVTGHESQKHNVMLKKRLFLSESTFGLFNASVCYSGALNGSIQTNTLSW